MTYDCQTNYDKLLAQHVEMARLLAEGGERVAVRRMDVSGWSPLEHIHHLAIANRNVANAVHMILGDKTERGVEHGRELNPRAGEILESGNIPGGVKAPEFVAPPDNPERAAVERALGQADKRLAGLGSHLAELPGCPGWVAHPLLRWMNGPQWLRFGVIHTAHHLRIVDAILAD